jgi:hypothetical protein
MASDQGGVPDAVPVSSNFCATCNLFKGHWTAVCTICVPPSGSAAAVIPTSRVGDTGGTSCADLNESAFAIAGTGGTDEDDFATAGTGGTDEDDFAAAGTGGTDEDDSAFDTAGSGSLDEDDSAFDTAGSGSLDEDDSDVGSNSDANDDSVPLLSPTPVRAFRMFGRCTDWDA